MTNAAVKTENNHAIQNAKAWLESIYDMMNRFDAAVEPDTGDDQDTIRDEILQSPLSVQVRGGWHTPGAESEPEEYEILLSTGGPALRIIGDLSSYREPSSARLEWQDWGTPWTEYRDPKGHTHDAILTAFANQFYFGD